MLQLTKKHALQTHIIENNANLEIIKLKYFQTMEKISFKIYKKMSSVMGARTTAISHN